MQKLSKELIKKLIYEALEPSKQKLTKSAVKDIIRDEINSYNEAKR